MTVFCPLNQPQCKRSIMMSRGSFVKLECPISKGRKCAFVPSVCPMINQDKEECYSTKIQDVVDQGGCKVENLQPPLIAEMCKCKIDRVSPEQNRTGKTADLPPHCAELPPCTRCPFGRSSEDARGSNDSIKNKSKQKKANRYRRSMNSKDIKMAATPNGPSCYLENQKLPILSRQKKSRKEVKGTPTRMTKTEDIKVTAGPGPEGLPTSSQPKSQVASPETREKIFREAIEDKVAKLSKNRESLLVPQCSSASRRPMPCAGCLMDLLSSLPLAKQPETNYEYVHKSSVEERCHLKKILATCPALRIPSMCPKGCSCPDVALLDEEEDDEICPFAMDVTANQPGSKPLPTEYIPWPLPKCPLIRLANNPLVLDARKIPQKGNSFDACKCPLIPNNCYYTLPGCPIHTMRSIIGACPNLSNH